MSKPDTNAVLGNTSSAAAFIASSSGRNSGTCYIACFERETAAQKLAEVEKTIVQLFAISLELSSKG